VNVGAFIIHLERAHQRRPQVDQLRRTIPLPSVVIDAVDGAAMPGDERTRVYVRQLLRPHYPFDLSATEIGCFLSHRKAWQAILDSDLDAGLVVEDDVELDMQAFGPGLRLATDAIGGGTLVRFPFRGYSDRGARVSGDGIRDLIAPKVIGLGMQVQIIDKVAAERLLSATVRFDRPVDTFVQMRWHHGLRVLAIQPSGVSEIGGMLGGSIVQNRSRRSAPRPVRELKRLFYRLAVQRYSSIETSAN
jgi:GR25 family glycosyltransferase involved in LPS biosynthesis